MLMACYTNLARGSSLSQANVKFVIKQLLIICTNIQCDWQALQHYWYHLCIKKKSSLNNSTKVDMKSLQQMDELLPGQCKGKVWQESPFPK